YGTCFMNLDRLSRAASGTCRINTVQTHERHGLCAYKWINVINVVSIFFFMPAALCTCGESGATTYTMFKFQVQSYCQCDAPSFCMFNFSICAAQALYSGIFEIGSSAAIVSRLIDSS